VIGRLLIQTHAKPSEKGTQKGNDIKSAPGKVCKNTQKV
jgi:hypothetical protein